MQSLPDAHQDEIAEISQWFATAPTPHGVVFDDGRRWCESCQAPRWMCQAADDDRWADRTCPECRTLWPEHMFTVMQEMAEDLDEEMVVAIVH